MAGVHGPGLGTPLKPFYRESMALAGYRNFNVVISIRSGVK